jgi:formiminotetrahydrofolate cyclodeaminase
MNNADVPMWDKGDKTDDFATGGGSFASFGGASATDRIPMIEEAYELVLKRKPTSREISYYKYSTMKKEEIIKKLLNDKEHTQLLEKGRDYPNLEESQKLSASTVLKLKHGIKDQESEFEELKKLLSEKNKIIEELRSLKEEPYVSDKTFLEHRNTYYDTMRSAYTTVDERIENIKKLSWLDKLFNFLMSLSK